MSAYLRLIEWKLNLSLKTETYPTSTAFDIISFPNDLLRS